MLKATGIVRRVDQLGRVVLPIELREHYGIQVRTPMEIFTEDDRIILRRYEPLCVFCSSGSGVQELYGRYVCAGCRVSLMTGPQITVAR